MSKAQEVNLFNRRAPKSFKKEAVPSRVRTQNTRQMEQHKTGKSQRWDRQGSFGQSVPECRLSRKYHRVMSVSSWQALQRVQRPSTHIQPQNVAKKNRTFTKREDRVHCWFCGLARWVRIRGYMTTYKTQHSWTCACFIHWCISCWYLVSHIHRTMSYRYYVVKKHLPIKKKIPLGEKRGEKF